MLSVDERSCVGHAVSNLDLLFFLLLFVVVVCCCCLFLFFFQHCKKKTEHSKQSVEIMREH